MDSLVGLLATSKAGHDNGKVYAVVREEEQKVWLADGKIRTVSEPKQKNKKHIQIIKELPKEVAELLEEGFRNEDVKRAIVIYQEGIKWQKPMQ